ncbi:hypothetical protein [Neogemmobacter tilapiae]|uniref:Flagellar protein FlgN n=1 Tax=Neogemmobacter tilapiae TaxID=875041 RepID=A0A918WJL4_9RHOB|nr:hypothetical protein [Gemmobacter tilapiae]GHC51875.1 hypothetical protein GCM10007315_12890 [Gemmobacter tilapiae]
MTPEEQMQALEQVLDALSGDLLQGRWDNLTLHRQQIEMFLPALESLADSPQAKRLRASAQRNVRCLDASGRGLRAARQRLAEVIAAAQGLATYDGKGRRAAMEPPAPQMARRI